jgi:hypothetical protein
MRGDLVDILLIEAISSVSASLLWLRVDGTTP